MIGYKSYIVILLIATSSAHPADLTSGDEPKGNSIWKGTSLDQVVDQIYTDCLQNDTVACMKYKVLTFLDQVLRKDSFQLSENVSVEKNSYTPVEEEQVVNVAPVEDESRAFEDEFLNKLEKYIQSHDVNIRLPKLFFEGSTLNISPRSLDKNEVTLSLKLSEEARGLDEARKSKIKKILIPILVFVMLKAITLIPLALGVLGLKAWNALQLSFFSFVVSVALAIFNLCKKLADNGPPAVHQTHHYDAYAAAYARGLNSNEWGAQNLAYRGQSEANDA